MIRDSVFWILLVDAMNRCVAVEAALAAGDDIAFHDQIHTPYSDPAHPLYDLALWPDRNASIGKDFAFELPFWLCVLCFLRLACLTFDSVALHASLVSIGLFAPCLTFTSVASLALLDLVGLLGFYFVLAGGLSCCIGAG